MNTTNGSVLRMVAREGWAAGEAPGGVVRPSEEMGVRSVRPKIPGNQSLTAMDPQYTLGGEGFRRMVSWGGESTGTKRGQVP